MTQYDVLHAGQIDEFRGPDGGDTHPWSWVMPGLVPRSFELAFKDLYGLSYRVAFRIVGDRSEAEEIAQEALARAALRWSRLHEHPEGWVSRVSSNLAIDTYRRRRREPPLPSGPLGVVDPLIGERTDLVAALRNLPKRQRDVVVLRYLGDLSEADTAAALGCSPGAVKTHAARGLSALRHSLEVPPTNPGGDDVRAS